MEKKLFEKAVLKWGVQPQINQAMEECAELIQALNKFSRHKLIDPTNLIEEIADVEIMLSQIKFIIDYVVPFNSLDLRTTEDKVKEAKLQKLDNLKKLLKNY